MFVEFSNGVHYLHADTVVQVFDISKYPRLCIVKGFVGNFVSLRLLHPCKGETEQIFKSAHGFADDLFVQQGI